MPLKLVIGDKNYSSWSLRAALALDLTGVPYEEILERLYRPDSRARLLSHSPTGKVPVLHHGAVRVWESLAIIEYVAELFPEAGIWPKDRAARAEARAISMEMLSGFRALRNACPMNIRRKPGAIDLPDGVTDDVARIETIWKDALARSGGPFLFGGFCAADAMYAPVVNRLEIYRLTEDETVLAYMERVKAHPAWRKWQAAALAEPWIVPEDEA